VVEQSADGIYLVDVLTLEVVHCNAAFCSMLGYTIAEMQTLSIFNIIADDYSEINRRVSAVLTGNSAAIEERVYRMKSGSSLDVLASSTVIAYGGKRVICKIVRDISERKKLEREREMLIKQLQDAISNIRTLGGLIPICSNCKKIRDDKGYWNHLEKYLSEHSEATLSHGICPDCAKKLYPEVFDK
jgi:PAS domain S-box-containing protein